LQKIVSIFFISLLTFYQYGKALSYLHCIFTNIVNTGNAYCDCEKQIKDSDDNSQSSSAKKTNFKEKATENWLAYCRQDISQSCHTKIALTIANHNPSRLSTGFHNSVFQPPKA